MEIAKARLLAQIRITDVKSERMCDLVKALQFELDKEYAQGVRFSETDSIEGNGTAEYKLSANDIH